MTIGARIGRSLPIRSEVVEAPPVVPSWRTTWPALVAEHVADDAVAVVLVDVVEVHPALGQVVVVLADGGGEGLRAAGVGGVGLDSPEQRGQRLPGGLLRGALVHAEASARSVSGMRTGCRRRRSWTATLVGRSTPPPGRRRAGCRPAARHTGSARRATRERTMSNPPAMREHHVISDRANRSPAEKSVLR